MSNPTSEGVNTTEANDETQSLSIHEIGEVNSAGSNLRTPVMSDEIAWQIKAATDPLTKQSDTLSFIEGSLTSPSKMQRRSQCLDSRPFKSRQP